MGWDLTLRGLDLHLKSNEALDHTTAHAWMASPEGNAFMRGSAEAWALAHVLGGENPEVAKGMAERTAAFYSGG